MRRPLVCLALLSLFAGLPLAQDKAPALAVGRDLPGTFHPYNVTARVVRLAKADPDDKDRPADAPPPQTRGRFHCLITEYNLDPVIVCFAHGNEDNKALAATLKKIDESIENHPAVPLRCFVVFLDKGLARVMEDDTGRAAAVKRVEAATTGMALRHVVLTIAGTEDVKAYDLDATLPVTAVLYHKLRVKAIHKLNKDALEKEDSTALTALLADAEKQLGARGLVPEAKGKK